MRLFQRTNQSGAPLLTKWCSHPMCCFSITDLDVPFHWHFIRQFQSTVGLSVCSYWEFGIHLKVWLFCMNLTLKLQLINDLFFNSRWQSNVTGAALIHRITYCIQALHMEGDKLRSLFASLATNFGIVCNIALFQVLLVVHIFCITWIIAGQLWKCKCRAHAAWDMLMLGWEPETCFLWPIKAACFYNAYSG